MNKKILVAAAWPYANGSLHFGHVAALIGSDILARYFRLNGHSVLFVSGRGVIPKPNGFKMNKHVKNFQIVKKGEIIGKKENTIIRAKNFFYPILFGAKSYKEIFGFYAKRVVKL